MIYKKQTKMKQESQGYKRSQATATKTKKICKIWTKRSCNMPRELTEIIHKNIKDVIFQQQEQKQQNHQIGDQLNIKPSIQEQKIKSFKIEEVLNLNKCQDISLPSAISSKQKLFPLFVSEFYDAVDEIDFNIYTSALTRSRIYSVILVDKYGRIIYSDKLGHQLFEGSLNNFQRIHIQDLIVASQITQFHRAIKCINQQNRSIITKMLIYSKNAKRRYSRQEFVDSITDNQIYNRFLKSITCRMKPIRIIFQDYNQFQGFWNKEFIQNNLTIQCFMIQSRLSVILPKLADLSLPTDPTVMKYIASNKKKISIKKSLLNSKSLEYKNQIKPNNIKSSSQVLKIKLQQDMSLKIKANQNKLSNKIQKMQIIEQVKGITQSLDINEFF